MFPEGSHAATILTDPETGGFLGEYDEWLEAPEGAEAPRPISRYTAYETFVTADTGQP